MAHGLVIRLSLKGDEVPLVRSPGSAGKGWTSSVPAHYSRHEREQRGAFSMLRRIYLSSLGRLISFAMNLLAFAHKPFMVYGYRDVPSKTWRKFTRVSSSATLSAREGIFMSDHVWVSHYAFIDGSNGVKIGRGVQICSCVGIFSHGSHNALRLHGERFIEIDHAERKGYARGLVTIGDFTFIGAGAVVLPGVTIGKGAMIAAGSVVTKDIPDFAIARGAPATVIGDTRERDQVYWDHPDIRESYFDPQGMQEWMQAQRSH
jgi:acetyltransferase-like isoleucine patch superfamily enzyme